ncbi:MAG: J domain-containing protein [Candidatus Methanoperedens sp.]|nr:J domain-containing protein [Candidatus Methanoperedens sp.]
MAKVNPNIGRMATTKSIEAAMKEITRWLGMIGINGLEIDIRHDAASNVALLRFKYKGKEYEFRSTRQSNCRLNMWGIARVMEYKVRSQLMGIENFADSMAKYELRLEGCVEPQKRDVNELNYVILGISPLASNPELQAKYKTLMKTFHPDMVLSEETKKEFERKAAEINKAWDEIKKERGIL